jgi:hypothetical protein
MVGRGCVLVVMVTVFSGMAVSQAAAIRCWPPERQDCGYDTRGGPHYNYHFGSNKPTKPRLPSQRTNYSH